MLSTIENLYLGKTELFKNLAIEKYLNDPLFQKHTVIDLDLSSISPSYGISGVENDLMLLLKLKAENLNIELSSSMPHAAFGELIHRLANRDGKVVILIDEYDRVLIDSFDTPKLQNSIRKLFRDFYYQIKSKNKYVHAVYITGISKYTKMGVFSAANNIVDLSTHKDFCTMLGYTHEEVVANFKYYIHETSRHFNITEDTLLAKLKTYYDGYSFCGDSSTVYNPTSIHSFFTEKKFDNYWIETGQQEFIESYIAKSKFKVEDFEHYKITLRQLKMPGEVKKSIAPALYLYQAGYLTPREDLKKKNAYYLTYPNNEVRSSMIELTENNFFTDIRFEDEVDANIKKLHECLNNEDYIAIYSIFNDIFLKIVYDDYNKSNKNELRLECFYRNTIYLLMMNAGLDIRPEEHKSVGRVDLVLYHANKIILFELKVSGSGTDANIKKKFREANEQMDEYAKAYKNPISICITINAKRRQIALASIDDDVYKGVHNPKKRVPDTYERIGDLQRILESIPKSSDKTQ
jgi:hypothetical protein